MLMLGLLPPPPLLLVLPLLLPLPLQVSKFEDPHEACLSVVAESYRLWLQYETRTDDITMIMMQFVGLDQPPPQLTPLR